MIIHPIILNDMKVICIDDVWETIGVCGPAPVFGEIVTVFESISDETGDWYKLEEYDPNEVFGQEGFAPLSDIDEIELVKERELVNV
jgi:hypothetical protein